MHGATYHDPVWNLHCSKIFLQFHQDYISKAHCKKNFPHHPRKSLWYPSPHCPFPMQSLFSVPLVEITFASSRTSYKWSLQYVQCSCFTMLCYFLLDSKLNQLCVCVCTYIYPIFLISFAFRSPQIIEDSYLCYTASSH